MSETERAASIKPRGAKLLEEFEKSLPNFKSLDEERHIEFTQAIHLLSCYLKITPDKLEHLALPMTRSIMAFLKQLRGEYIGKNEIIAAAIFVVMAHIESFYLDDPDAKLVHNLTGLQIYHAIPLGSASRPLLHH